MFSKGVASQEGTIHRGDLILSINGVCLAGSVHGDVLNALHQARLHKFAIIVIKKDKGGEKMSSSHPEPATPGRQTLVARKDATIERGTGMVSMQQQLERIPSKGKIDAWIKHRTVCVITVCAFVQFGPEQMKIHLSFDLNSLGTKRAFQEVINKQVDISGQGQLLQN